MKVILEYSEEQKCFHNNIGNTEENTNGYKTLGEVSKLNSTVFIRLINRKYPNRNVTFEKIKEEFKNIFDFSL